MTRTSSAESHGMGVAFDRRSVDFDMGGCAFCGCVGLNGFPGPTLEQTRGAILAACMRRALVLRAIGLGTALLAAAAASGCSRDERRVPTEATPAAEAAHEPRP